MQKFFAPLARILAIVVMLTGSASPAVAQQPFPNRTIRVVVPYPPGGSTTNVMRLVGQKLTESWGQPVIIDNRPGGNTVIGTDAVAKAPPDGYTMLLTTNGHVINPNLLPNLPYDPIKDFAPITTVFSTELLLVLHPSVPVTNLQEFIALAKSRPGQLNYASTGVGSVNQLANELFNMMVGVRMLHIPYKGTGQVIADLVGGQVQLFFCQPLSAIPLINSGKLKAIAVSGEARVPALPQVPTFTEAGLPGLDVKTWVGVLAPARTPKEIIDRVSNEIRRVLAMPDTKEKIVSQGVEPLISTTEQFTALMLADLAKFARIVKTANIKLEN